ncbi:MAG: DUF2240 family protein [Euryarchaeota archaeon]|nr:DUF2240 family protein [Euryarchaeota archaeon]
MSVEELVRVIASECGRDEAEILRLVEDKQKELGGLITPEGAAHVVANELGVNLLSTLSRTEDTEIERIIPGMKSVSVVGRITRIYGVREFSRNDGTTGRVGSLILADSTGSIRVVFWGRDTEKLQKLQEGMIVRLRNAYTKADLNGEPEVHVGSSTVVVPSPPDVDPSAFPEAEVVEKSIAELQDGDQNVNVLCKVLRVYELREFRREDGSTGKVLSMRVADTTGKARLVLWGENASLGAEVSEGDVLRVVKGYVKLRMGEKELHVGRYGKVVLCPEEAEALADVSEQVERKSIAELQEGEEAEVRGALVSIGDELRLFERGDSKGAVINAVIDDGTGNIRVAFYDKLAETLLNIPLERILAGEVQDEEIEARRQELLGREVVLRGRVRRSDFTGRNELVVADIDLHPDPRQEAEMLLRKLKQMKREEE